jgi:hypothetical protein
MAGSKDPAIFAVGKKNGLSKWNPGTIARAETNIRITVLPLGDATFPFLDKVRLDYDQGLLGRSRLLGPRGMNSFIVWARVLPAGLPLLVMLSVPAISQDRDSLMRRCLSIADVNERIDCLETGGAPDSGSNINPLKQPSTNPSLDCRAARTSIERATAQSSLVEPTVTA